MAFRKQKQSSFITIILKTAFMVVHVIATTNIDCKGKAFHCVNSTHFKICVDFGGVSKTVDDFLIPCPPSTSCTDTNYYECEYQMPTTSAALDLQSDVTNELSESTVSSPWELFEVTTFFPLNSNERSVELSENNNITPLDTVFEAADTETVDIHNYSLVTEVQNEVITENILYETTVSDFSESDINSPKSKDVISSTTVTAAINSMPNYLNTTISYAVVNVDNKSTTESAISGGLFNTFKTTAVNNAEDAGSKDTTLFSPVMTRNLNTNGTSEKVTTEKYISTKSEIANDLYEPVITTPRNNIEYEDSTSPTLDNLSSNRIAEKATTEKYTTAKSEVANDLYETVITTLTNNIENENLPSTRTDNLSTSDTAEKATTEKYTSTTREIAIDLFEPVITTVTNNIADENLPSTITDNLSTWDTAEEATTEKYTSTTREIGFNLYEPVIKTLTNNIGNEDFPSPTTDNLKTNGSAEKATTEKYTSTKSEIATDLYEPLITTLTNNIEKENLASKITNNLSTSDTAEKATTEKYTSTTREMAIDLFEPVITTLTNNIVDENLPSTITDNLSTWDTAEEATTEKYTSTTREIAFDLYEPVITTLTNNIADENLPSTITDNLSTWDTAEEATTEKYTSTTREIAFDLYEPVITTLTNNIADENLPSTITDNLSTWDTAEEATTEKYTSTTREIAFDLYEPVITTLTNNIADENLPSTITDNLSTWDTAEEPTTEKYTSTTKEIVFDLYEPVITTLTNNIENEDSSSPTTVNIKTNGSAEKATTEKYISTKSEIATDLYEPLTTTLTNNIEKENLPSTINDNLSTWDTAEEPTTEKYTSTTKEIVFDLYETVITTLTNNIENEDSSSPTTVNIKTNGSAEKATTEKYISTKSEIATDLYEPLTTTLTNNIEKENLPSTINDNLSTWDTAEEATTEKYTSTNSEIATDLYEPVITTLRNNIENEDLSSTIIDYLIINRTTEKAKTEKYTSIKSDTTIDLYEPVITTLTNNIANDTAEEATTEKYTSITRETVIDLYEPLITFTNNIEKDFTSPKTDNLRTNGSIEKITTETYISTKSEISIDLYEPVITTLTNNIQNEDSLSLSTNNLRSNRTVEKETTEKYTSTQSEMVIDLYEPIITTLTNNLETENFSSTITVNLSTIGMNDKATTEKYTSTNSEISFDFYEPDIATLNNTKIEDFQSTTLSSAIIDNINTNFSSPKKQKDFLSVTRADSLNIENNFTTDINDSTKNTAENIIQKEMSLKDFKQPTTQVSIFYKEDSNKEKIHSNINYRHTTVYSPVITESNSNNEYIINSSTEAITFSTISDSYLVNVQQDTATKDVNFPTTKKESYTNAAINSSHVDDTSMHETPTSNTDLSFTPGYDKELQLATDINLILKNTTEEISANEQNGTYLQMSENDSFSEDNNEILVKKSTVSIIDPAISHEANLLIASTANEIEVHTNNGKKTSNDTAEQILTHQKDILKKVVDDINLPPNADSITASFLETNSDQRSLTTVDVGLNSQVEENNHLLPSLVNSESSLVTDIILKNLTLFSEMIVTTESYKVHSQENTAVANLQLSTSSLTDETIEYQPNNQNSKVMETLTHEFFVTIDEYGSNPNLTTQHYNNDDNTGSISSPSMSTSFAKTEYSDKLKESPINLTKKQTTKIDKDLSKTHVKTYDSMSSTINSRETFIYNTVNNMHSSQNDSEYLFLFNSTNIPVSITESAQLDSNDSEIKIINSSIANIFSTLDTNKNSNTSVESNKMIIYNATQDLKPDQSSIYKTKMNDELSLKSEKNNYVTLINAAHINKTLVKNQNNLRFALEGNLNPPAGASKALVKDKFDNISENLENVSRNYQNNSNYNIISNKTRKDLIDIYAWFINKNKQINIPANQDKRKDQNNRTAQITANVHLNDSNSSKDYDKTQIKFNCKNIHRGKYSNKNDCQKFYICIGRSEPILGKCPSNTVFSEISKQCTKNLSHCIRNNQFHCPSEGRYIDIFSDQFYFICAKNVEGYIRFKLKCQKGYHLDKSKLQCILDSLNGSVSHEDISETDREKSTIESKSKEETDSKNQKNDFHLKCQNGYHLDKSKLQCILDSLNGSISNEDISKTDREKSTTESKSKEERDSKNQKSNFECKKEGKFVYPEDCRKYYQCTTVGKSEFRRKIKKCDDDEIFHSEKRKCVDDDSYECNK